MSVEEFLRQRAVEVTVGGSYSLPRWYDCEGKPRTFACRTKRVSPFRMIVEVPVIGRVGDRITSYFGEFGEFEGSISDTRQGSILLELEMTPEKREWMADKLSWLEKKYRDPSIKDARKDARYVPQAFHTTLTLADGRITTCFIIDVSPTGVSVSSEVQPPIGMPLAVGSCIGRVVRIFNSGFAVKFVDRQNLNDLSRLIIRTEETTSGSSQLAMAVP
jgi:hypothetical protein